MSFSLFSWMKLARCPDVGPKRFWSLLEKFQTPEEALQNIKCLPDDNSLKKDIDFCRKHNIIPLPAFDMHFPRSLRERPDCPPLLYIKGDTSIFHAPMISIVGGRRSSILAQQWVGDLAASIALRGIIVVSGMARGIDGAAHQGALKTGKTLAVLAGGIDRIYPFEHRRLYENIQEKGLVLSEEIPGTPPHPHLFPKRNRLIATLGEALIIVEASHQSGTLITAREALSIGREIFVVPGSPWDPKSTGSNQLIKDGAMMCESIDDLEFFLQKLSPLQNQEHVTKKNHEQPSILSCLPEEQKILDLLSSVPISLSKITSALSLPPSMILPTLTSLELLGKIKRYPDGQFGL